MIEHEKIILDYFECWLKQNPSKLEEIFHSKVIYSECYGPEYQGIETIERWFTDWHQHGKVLAWDIKQFIHQGNTTAVEWYFKCDYDGNVSDFDGVSIIEFDDNNRIVNLKEFQSKIPHYHPYS